MATQVLQHFETRFADSRKVAPSYEEVFDSPKVAPIPWHLISLRKVAVVAGVFVLWWVAFGFMVAVSTT